ncbi:MAG: hypothetical protein ABL993_11705 [Vicinamibacterales bacterium]
MVRLSSACAARLKGAVLTNEAPDAAAGARLLEPDFGALLDTLRALDPRFDFDRNGRPAAIHAVREALPATEREIFDAIVEDHTCEVAAVQQAMLLVAQACARQVGTD